MSFISLSIHALQIGITSALTTTHKRITVCNKTGGGEQVFCNPPYSTIAQWVRKCYLEGTKKNTTVVLLIPSRTDTKYFHNYIYQRSEIRFLKGRLHFNDSKYSAPFPSMVVIFRGYTEDK